MLNLKSLAITGGFSSGKSSVCSILQEHGAYVAQCDSIVHSLYDSDKELQTKVINLFGEDVKSNGTIDRNRLAEKAFSDKQQLKALEEIVHPLVRATIQKERDQAEKSGIHPLFVAEVPLLFEGDLHTFFDYTLFVDCDRKKAIERASDRGFSEEEYILRMENQLPIPDKKRQADFVIENNGNKQELESAVMELLHKIV